MSTDRLCVAADVLFDGRDRHERMLVRIQDRRIRAIEHVPDADWAGVRGKADRATPFAGPGLVDAHVHITGYREGIPAGNPFEAAKHFLRLCLAGGVTTVRDTGNSIEAIEYLREWSDRFDGPAIVASGPLLDTPPLTWPFSRIVRDEVSAKSQVDRLASEGVDLLKAYRNVQPHTLRAICAAAAERGLDVAVDLEATSIEDACRAGVRSVEHAATLTAAGRLRPDSACSCTEGAAATVRGWAHVDPHGVQVRRLLDLFLAHEVVLVPTLLVTRRWTFFDEMAGEPLNALMSAVMPYHRHFDRMRGAIGSRIGRRIASRFMPVEPLNKGELAEASEGIERMRAVVELFSRSGVPIVAGTDAPNPSVVPGFGLWQELEQLVASGLAPLQALRAATSAAGRLLRRRDIGVLEQGASADLVLTDGDPTTRISDLRTVHDVVIRGRPVDRAAVLRRVEEAVEA